MRTSTNLTTQNLKLSYALSLAIALLMTVVSLAGLFSQSSLYPSEELRRSFVSNDLVNIFIGLPILLGSMWLTRRGVLIGLLFWPGALFYVAYNYIAYAVAMPFTFQFIIYLLLVFWSLYGAWRLLSGMDSTVIQQRLKGAVPERFAGGVLAGLGTLFFLWRTSLVLSALTGGTTLAKPELGVVVADLLTTPIWVIGGVMLWKRRPFGYLTGAGLLFLGSMLFIGLLVFFILQPFLTEVPFPVSDFVVVLVMGLICFVPFGLFVRGALSSEAGI
jgi:hypothetical protein